METATDPLSRDPAIDMYNPDNGPAYSESFIQRYRAAQIARNETITALAEEGLEGVRAGRPQCSKALSSMESFGTVSKDGIGDISQS